MNLLLDANALLWALSDSRKLGQKARRRIADPNCSVWVSAATCWEISIKASLRRLQLDGPPERVLADAFRRGGYMALPVTMEHAYAVYALPFHHTNPFDRILIAQAQLEGLMIVTADQIFDAYGVSVLDATE